MSKLNRMVGIRKKILESNNVTIYKKLLNIFGDFCDKFPASSVDTLFELLVSQGIKVLPKDKRALDILKYMTAECDSIPMRVQNILNKRFSNLPAELRPITKSGRRHEIAFWCKDGEVFDQVKKLLNFEGNATGYWSDADGKKLQLLDTKV